MVAACFFFWALFAAVAFVFDPERFGVFTFHEIAEIAELEHEASSFTISYILNKAVMHAIIGQYFGMESHLPDDPVKRYIFAAYTCFVSVLAVGIKVFVSNDMINRYLRELGFHWHRIKEFMETFLAMTCAWACFYLSEWQALETFEYLPTSLAGFHESFSHTALHMALLSTFFTIMTGIIILFLGWFDRDDDYDFDEIVIQAASICTGFSWEHTFDVCVTEFAMQYPGSEVALKITLSCIVIALVFPALMFVIHPVYHHHIQVSEYFEVKGQQRQSHVPDTNKSGITDDTRFDPSHIGGYHDPSALQVGMMDFSFNRKDLVSRASLAGQAISEVTQRMLTRMSSAGSAASAEREKLLREMTKEHT